MPGSSPIARLFSNLVRSAHAGKNAPKEYHQNIKILFEMTKEILLENQDPARETARALSNPAAKIKAATAPIGANPDIWVKLAENYIRTKDPYLDPNELVIFFANLINKWTNQLTPENEIIFERDWVSYAKEKNINIEHLRDLYDKTQNTTEFDSLVALDPDLQEIIEYITENKMTLADLIRSRENAPPPEEGNELTLVNRSARSGPDNRQLARAFENGVLALQDSKRDQQEIAKLLLKAAGQTRNEVIRATDQTREDLIKQNKDIAKRQELQATEQENKRLKDEKWKEEFYLVEIAMTAGFCAAIAELIVILNSDNLSEHNIDAFVENHANPTMAMLAVAGFWVFMNLMLVARRWTYINVNHSKWLEAALFIGEVAALGGSLYFAYHQDSGEHGRLAEQGMTICLDSIANGALDLGGFVYSNASVPSATTAAALGVSGYIFKYMWPLIVSVSTPSIRQLPTLLARTVSSWGFLERADTKLKDKLKAHIGAAFTKISVHTGGYSF